MFQRFIKSAKMFLIQRVSEKFLVGCIITIPLIAVGMFLVMTGFCWFCVLLAQHHVTLVTHHIPAITGFLEKWRYGIKVYLDLAFVPVVLLCVVVVLKFIAILSEVTSFNWMLYSTEYTVKEPIKLKDGSVLDKESSCFDIHFGKYSGYFNLRRIARSYRAKITCLRRAEYDGLLELIRQLEAGEGPFTRDTVFRACSHMVNDHFIKSFHAIEPEKQDSKVSLFGIVRMFGTYIALSSMILIGNAFTKGFKLKELNPFKLIGAQRLCFIPAENLIAQKDFIQGKLDRLNAPITAELNKRL